ncbi:zinc ribbon domain-containing protein, partial [Propionibacterium freudenreichii]|nr:zinc ribbon domain-containing protein [Propionibacterium freudenreichii]
MQLYCGNCGAPLPTGATVCQQCGTPVAPLTSEATMPPTSPTPPGNQPLWQPAQGYGAEAPAV